MATPALAKTLHILVKAKVVAFSDHCILREILQAAFQVSMSELKHSTENPRNCPRLLCVLSVLTWLSDRFPARAATLHNQSLRAVIEIYLLLLSFRRISTDNSLSWSRVSQLWLQP